MKDNTGCLGEAMIDDWNPSKIIVLDTKRATRFRKRQ